MKKKAVRSVFIASVVAASMWATVVVLNAFVVPDGLSRTLSRYLPPGSGVEAGFGSARLSVWQGLILKDVSLVSPGTFVLHAPVVRVRFGVPFFSAGRLVVGMFVTVVSPDLTLQTYEADYGRVTDFFRSPPRARVLFVPVSVAVRNASAHGVFGDVNDIKARARLKYPGILSADIEVAGEPSVRAQVRVNVHENTARGRLRCAGLRAEKTGALFERIGLIAGRGTYGFNADWYYRDRVVFAAARMQADALDVARPPFEMSLSGDANLRVKHSLDTGSTVYAGTMRCVDSSIAGFGGFGTVEGITGSVSLSNSRIFSENISARIWGLGLNARFMVSDFDDPVVSVRLTCASDLEALARVAKEQYRFSLPARLSGDAFLTLEVLSRPFSRETFDELNGTLSVDGAQAILDAGMAVERISGLAAFSPGGMEWKDMRFEYGKHRFRSVGTLKNFAAPVVHARCSSDDLSFETAFSISGGAMRIATLAGKYARSLFILSGTVIPGAAQPVCELKGDATIDARDLDRFLEPAAYDVLRPSGTLGARVEARGPVGKEGLKLSLILTGKYLNLYGLEWSNLFAEYNQSHGVIDVPHASAALYGGSIRASGSLNTRARAKPYWLTLEAVGVDIGRLKESLPAREKDIGGILTLNAALNGFLSDASQVCGNGNARISNGRLWSLNLFKGMGRLIFTRDFTDIVFREGTCSFKLGERAVSSGDVVMKGDIATVTGSLRAGFDASLGGQLDVEIHDEEVPLTGTFRDVTTALASRSGRFGTITLSGTLDEPRYVFKTDLKGILKGTQSRQPAAAVSAAGTADDPLIDSAMTRLEALSGVDPGCPQKIVQSLLLIDVLYYSFDARVHRGQVLIHRDCAADIKELFRAAFEEKFPFASVIPLADPRFRRNGRWSDDLSMRANNTSAFHYRAKTASQALSAHALGCAIDINPRLNPFIAKGVVLPRGAAYAPKVPGTLRQDSQIVRAMQGLGWIWGGAWKGVTDYQHFENPSKCARISQDMESSQTKVISVE